MNDGIEHKIAKEAVHETFKALFNIDIDETESRESFQRDLLFMRDLRRTSDTAKGAIVKTFIGLAVAGIVAAFWRGFSGGA